MNIKVLKSIGFIAVVVSSVIIQSFAWKLMGNWAIAILFLTMPPIWFSIRDLLILWGYDK